VKINKGTRVERNKINAAMLKMRNSGATWGQISIRFKIGRSNACQRVKRHKKNTTELQAKEKLSLDSFLAEERKITKIQAARKEYEEAVELAKQKYAETITLAQQKTNDKEYKVNELQIL
jgi:hypothetical protein